MNREKNYYRPLLCRPGDDATTVKQHYRQIVKRTHTDANNGSDEFRILYECAVEAYRILGNQQRRSEYEEARRIWLTEQGALQCEGCGEALRVRRGTQQHCPICKTIVQHQAQHSSWASKLREPLIDSGVRVIEAALTQTENEAELLGRELVAKGAVALSGIIANTFIHARNLVRKRSR